MKNSKTLLMCFLSIIFIHSYGQNRKTDSIKHLISISTNDTAKIKLLFSLSNRYQYNQPESTIFYLNRALPLIYKLKLGNQKALYYQKMGNALINQGKLEEGLNSSFNAISIYDSLGNQAGMANAYNLIGNVYGENTNYEQAIENFNKSIKIYELNTDSATMMSVKGNVGITLYRMKNDKQAIIILREVIAYFIQQNSRESVGVYLVFLAKAYYNIHRYTEALQADLSAMAYLENTSLHKFYGMACANAAQIKLHNKEFDEALKYNNLSLKILQKGNFTSEIKEGYKIFADIYEKLRDLDKCIYYYNKYIELKDTILTESNNKLITQMQARYDLKQKQTEINLLTTEAELKKSELKQQKTISFSIAAGFLLLLLVFYVLYINRIKIKKANSLLSVQNEEISKKNVLLEHQKIEIITQRDEISHTLEIVNQQKEEITVQKKAIEHSHKQITASITYAKRIQSAVLPNMDVVSELLPEHFIMFKPRDIVSGDFYFIKQIKNHLLIAAADCTGHGVPGAFMSMLGMTILNEIVRREEVKKASDVLEELRKQIKMSLQQTGVEDEQKDGMDIAFCAINMETMEMSFAGAHNPCLIYQNTQTPQGFQNLVGLIELPADHQPVGVFAKEKAFAEQNFQLQKGDVFFLFSDGYHSQFGGKNKLPFKAKNFKQILSEICNLPMSEQKQILETKFNVWKDENKQTDDVLVIGIRI